MISYKVQWYAVIWMTCDEMFWEKMIYDVPPETCFEGYVINEMKWRKWVVLPDLFTMKNIGTSCITYIHMHQDIFPYDEYEHMHYEKENDHV